MNDVSGAQDPLSQWNEGEVKHAVLQFLSDITDETSNVFVPPTERIAVFDNDGTLWCEKPLLTQLEFIKDQFVHGQDHSQAHTHFSVFDRIQEQVESAIEHLANDVADVSKHLLAGVTVEQYSQDVLDWISQAKHPRFDCLYTKLCYSPMMEMLSLFRAFNFQCYIVSGGSTDFVRPWCESVYQVPTQNVIGSSLRTHLVEKSGKLILEYLPVPFYFDDGAAKVKSINRLIGKQPIAAFGNSSGDVQMLRWTKQAKRSIACLIHHTDDVREYKYSPDSLLHEGPSTLDLAKRYDWSVVDMKRDWREIFG
jgi:phosphoserine phosphatase